jgi:asparagine synthase (glutamine-hydrolysing)
MCGIVGARHDWLLAQGLDPEKAMRDAVASLAWRGPDGQQVVRAGAWWLGCARLAIGPKNARQPVVRRGGRFVGVMNGAITNARELWARFLPGVEKRALLPNDAWLPLLAVERGEPRVLGELRGHHAIAVVDTETGASFFVQDRYGEKPLFQAWRPARGHVAFASTPVALEHLGCPAPHVEERFAEWFRFGWMPRKERFTLSPSGSLTEQDVGTIIAHRASAADARSALIASVARCVDTRVPVALSLSGGLDSSCLALALHANGKRVPAYQLRAAGSPSKERNAATAVAARAQLPLRQVDVGPEVCDALPFLTACAGLPLGDPSILAVHALARAAAADGIRVLLSGEGADELLLGYRRYRALARLPRLTKLRRLAPSWSMRHSARLIRAMTAPDPATALLAVTPPAFGECVLAPEFAQHSCWRDESRTTHHDGRDPVLAARDADLRGYLRFDLLPKVDVGCMAAGVEARAPFLEGDCHAFGQDRSALGKRPLREAFASELPREVLRLPKTGFALPLDRWFRGELPWLDLLAEPRTQQRPHLRPGGIARVVDLHRRGKVDVGHGLYLLVAAELHLRDREQRERGIANSVPTAPGGAS